MCTINLSFKKIQQKILRNGGEIRTFVHACSKTACSDILGDSPETKKVEKLNFSEIKIDLIYHHFDTILGRFEPQGMLQCTKQS